MKTATALLWIFFAATEMPAAEVSVRTAPLNTKAFSAEVRDVFDLLQLPGLAVAVVQNGRVIHSQLEGFADLERKAPIRSDSIFWLASVTKTFSAALVMQYEQEGRIALDDPVIQYPFASVGFFPQRVDERVQLRHVLSHTSEAKPGDEFVYHGGRYNFIYGVFEQVSGLKFPNALHRELQNRVFKPLKMTSTLAGVPNTNQAALRARIVTPYRFDASTRRFTVNRDALSMQAAFPATGLLSTVTDLAAYTTALDEYRLLPKPAYARMTTPFVTNDGKEIPYGVGWFTEQFAGTTLHWAYGYGESDSAILLRVPSRRMTLIVLCNANLPSACSRLGSGGALHSPFVTAFMKHFILGAEVTEPLIDYSDSIERIRAGLKQRKQSHPIQSEELLSEALLRTYAEKATGAKKGQGEVLTQLLCELDRGVLTRNDPAVFHLLSEQPVAILDEAAGIAIDAYNASGRFHPWILWSIAQRYKAKGDVTRALAHSHKLVDTPGFEEQNEKQDACMFLARHYLQQGELGRARHYAWLGLIWMRQGGSNDSAAVKAIQEINRRAIEEKQ